MLHGETDDLRFERFCADLVELIEGGTKIVTTSRSWDRGRDGRSIGPGPRIIVCASITTTIADKMLGDLKKVAKSGVGVEKIYFCTTQDPSEWTLDQVAVELRAELPNATIEPMNATQLARMAGFHAEPLNRHYATELRDFQVWLTADDASEADVGESLLLALATAGQPGSSEIRSAAYKQMILRSLADDAARTLNELGVEIGGRLKLARPIPGSVLGVHIAPLETQGLVIKTGDKYARAPSGEAVAVDEEEAAAEALRDGQRDIRLALESALGHDLADKQFAAIWFVLEKNLTHFFATQGFRMVQAISALAATPGASADSESEVESDVPFFVDELAAAVGATSEMPEQRLELEQAIHDIFAERSGPAYQWIGSVCASFVLICMLGLEESSGSRLRDAIGGTYLIPDTDVVLEFLGDGEPAHEAAEQLVREWQRLGGHVLLAASVAEEVAHHAFISVHDYEEARNRFLRTEQDRRWFVRNVFVRAFGHLVEKKKLKPSGWTSFINDFRGKTKDDTAPLDELLVEDFHFDRLPDDDLREPPGSELWPELKNRINRSDATGRDRKIQLDKAKRDARLYASMAHFAEKLRAAGKSGSCVLVTSSGRLQGIGAKYGSAAEQTLSLAGAVYLLSMVPGVTLGRTALHTILFDSRLLHRGSELDVLVLRSVRDAGQEFPRARRRKLTRHVRTRLIELARDQGKPELKPENVASSATRDPSVQTVLSQVIADGLEQIAASSPAERELEAAQRRIRELEARLASRGG